MGTEDTLSVGEFPIETLISSGSPIATFDYQRVYLILPAIKPHIFEMSHLAIHQAAAKPKSDSFKTCTTRISLTGWIHAVDQPLRMARVGTQRERDIYIYICMYMYINIYIYIYLVGGFNPSEKISQLG